MKKARLHRLIRKSHRYLGVVFGIQFLFWTLGGLYFSWTSIKQIRGDDIRKDEPMLLLENSTTSLSQIIGELKTINPVLHIESVKLADVLGRAYYQITYHNGKKVKTQLADAQTGKLHAALTKEEAVAVAESRLNVKASVKKVEYITETDGHHEYREKPLPAFAVTFSGNANTTVYISAEGGTVQSFRNSRWRIFDFLWMLHTMDYANKDNLNNLLLRLFSALGLITIISGFSLYFISYKKKKHINSSLTI